MALETPHLGPGGEGGGTSAVGGDPRGLGSFQVHKGLASLMITLARGRAPAISEQSGIALLQEPGVVNLQLGWTTGVTAVLATPSREESEQPRVCPAGLLEEDRDSTKLPW